MELTRSSGILLHPTSLPGPFGIGDLGKTAYRFLDFLAVAEIGLWEILPLGPTGYGESPYQCFSAFAGNPALISPEILNEEGLLSDSLIDQHPRFSALKVDFNRVKTWKSALFRIAFEKFTKISPNDVLVLEFERFCESERAWLDDFALFSAIKKDFHDIAWIEWPQQYRFRRPSTLEEYRKNKEENLRYESFIQFCFYRQWNKLVTYAHERNIKIMGDIPLFISYDSADVWAHPELFDLDKNLNRRTVAGVPPDYFSPTGQLWGNPHYRWSNHKKTHYAWWQSRFRKTLEIMDIIRLDHFRGFSGYWEITAGQQTAQSGRWVKGPGSDFFETVQNRLGDLPIIAEDLGLISNDVHELLQQFNYPGMRILQFGFGSDARDPFLPHNYPKHCVAYTGTHDNDTVRGWFKTASQQEREYCIRYLNCKEKALAWEMIRAIWASSAGIAIAPMQDFLNLNTNSRMNFPGTLGGNWKWRMRNNALTDVLCHRIKDLNLTYGRNSSNKPFGSETLSMQYEEPDYV